MKTEEMLVTYVLKNAAGLPRNNGDPQALLKSHPIDWQRIMRLLIYHEVAASAYITLKPYRYILPQDFAQFLRDSYLYNTLRNEHFLQEFLRLREAFSEDGIVVAPIKGMAHLMDIYSDPSQRGMCDIDILVQDKDISRAEKVFYKFGYKKELLGLKEDYWRKRQYHISFFKKVSSMSSVMVELHWALDYKRRHDILPRLWQRLREVNIDKQNVYLLSPEDTFFSLALHNRRLGKALCLKNIIDMVLLLDKYKDFDWDYVLEEAKKGNVSTTIFFILSQAKIFLGFTPPPSIEDDLKVPNWKKGLIYRFIEENTFLPPQSSIMKELYLRSHFLLYDNFREPIEHILNIPQEQFARFYDLRPYDKRASLLYKNRFFYIPFKIAQRLISNGISQKRQA